MTQIKTVDLLILGAGWTSTFLSKLLTSSNITYAATSTTGRDDTIKWTFDPDSSDPRPYTLLPNAKTVLIVFPLKGPQQPITLSSLYTQTHPAARKPQYIQLGSTGIFTGQHWTDESSAYDKSNARAQAEDSLMQHCHGSTLNLAGLWGGDRQPRSWLSRVAKSKEALRTKKTLHLVHGEDVAKAIVALHLHFTPGKRWIVTDLCVYDWYDLAYKWEHSRQVAEEDESLQYRRWVSELMHEEGVRALPRDSGVLGRCLDSRGFWREVGALPHRPLFW